MTSWMGVSVASRKGMECLSKRFAGRVVLGTNPLPRITKWQNWNLWCKCVPLQTFLIVETGLFFKMLPCHSLSSEACTGGRHSKESVTVMVGANAVGTEKLLLLVVGNAENPCCFKGAKNLPVWYSSKTKAWISHSLSEDYICHQDGRYNQTSECQKRCVVFIENCGPHGAINNLLAVRLQLLPANTMSMLQPTDQRVIKNLDVHYWARLLGRKLMCFDSGKVYMLSLFSAPRMPADAWSAMEPSKNCQLFQACRFLRTGRASGSGYKCHR